MTWPTQPISTEHLQTDSGNPTLARSQIELAAQAVTAIINTIQPETAGAADILRYSSSNFLPVDLPGLIGLPVKIAVLNMGGAPGAENTNFVFSPNLHTKSVTVTTAVDPNNIMTVANNTVTVPPGSYLFSTFERSVVPDSNFAIQASLRAAQGSDPLTTDLIAAAAFTDTGVIGGTRFRLRPNLQFLRFVNTTETISFWVDGPISNNLISNFDDILVIKFD